MVRKDVFTTTGTRLRIGVSASSNFAEDEVVSPDFAKLGHDRGVPMGADLFNGPVGAAPLSAYWRDPDFDSDQRAFYYVRVLEIPTPRWTAYDAKFPDVDMPEGKPMTVQHRAHTLPIWYTPKL